MNENIISKELLEMIKRIEEISDLADKNKLEKKFNQKTLIKKKKIFETKQEVIDEAEKTNDEKNLDDLATKISDYIAGE